MSEFVFRVKREVSILAVSLLNCIKMDSSRASCSDVLFYGCSSQSESVFCRCGDKLPPKTTPRQAHDQSVTPFKELRQTYTALTNSRDHRLKRLARRATRARQKAIRFFNLATSIDQEFDHEINDGILEVIELERVGKLEIEEFEHVQTRGHHQITENSIPFT